MKTVVSLAALGLLLWTFGWRVTSPAPSPAATRMGVTDRERLELVGHAFQTCLETTANVDAACAVRYFAMLEGR